MNKQEFATIEEARAFVEPKLAEKKWVIDVRQEAEGAPYIVQWGEHKKYTALDGNQYHDEVWRKEDGSIHLVQDLEPEHAKNIIRMILRNDREDHARSDMLRAKIAEILTEGGMGDFIGDDEDGDEFPNGTYQVPGSTTLQ